VWEERSREAPSYPDSGRIIYANPEAQSLFHLENSRGGGFLFPEHLNTVNTTRLLSNFQLCQDGNPVPIELIGEEKPAVTFQGEVQPIQLADEWYYRVIFLQSGQTADPEPQNFCSRSCALINQHQDLPEMLAGILDLLFSYYGTGGGLAYIFDYQKNHLRLEQTSGISKQVGTDLNPIPFDKETIDTVFHKRQIMFIAEVDSDQRWTEIIDSTLLPPSGVKSFLGIPLYEGNQSIGMIGLLFTQLTHSPDLEDQKKLLALGNHLGMRIKMDQIEAREQKFFQQLSILRELLSLWRTAQTYDELIRTTALLIVERLKFWDLSFFQYLPETGMLKLVAIAGGLSSYLPIGYQQSISDGLLGRVVRDRKSHYSPDCRQDRQVIRVPDAGTLSELAVPVQIDEAIFGVINMESQRLEAFDDIDIWTMETLAQYLAIYLDNMRRSEKQNLRLENLEAITQITQFLNSKTSLQQLQQDFVELLRKILNIYYVSFYRFDHKHQHLIKISSAGGSERQRPIGAISSLDDGVLGWVAKNRKLLYVPDVNNHPIYLRISEKDYGSELCVPVLFADQIYGILNIESSDTHAFDENQLLILETITDHFAKALHNSILFEEIVQEKVKTDAVLSQMNEGVVIVDHADQIVYANRSAVAFFPQLDLKNPNQTLLLPFFPQAKAYLNPDISQTNFDFIDGNKIWQITAIRMQHTIGDENMLIVFDDFSEERQKEQQVIEHERIQMAVKMAGSIAHELNQPLTGILGYCSLLLEDIAPESNIAKDIQVIEDQANRIAALIKKFQNVVKVKTKPYLGEIEIVDWEESGTAEE